jgi:hypothetical protein
MGLLGFLRKEKRVHLDPALGALTYQSRSSCWEGETEFPDARGPIAVTVSGDEDGPSTHARATYDELQRRYAVLREEIAAALYELYDNYRSGATEGDYEDGLPRLHAPDQIWGTTCLDDITIRGRDPAELTIDMTYSFDWHSEHTFGVRIEDWKVAGVSIDG